jgi:hypothetical protein
MTVVPMVLGSAILMIIGSLITPPPSAETIERYFPGEGKTKEVFSAVGVPAR